jgi:hypothetical protein
MFGNACLDLDYFVWDGCPDGYVSCRLRIKKLKVKDCGSLILYFHVTELRAALLGK